MVTKTYVLTLIPGMLSASVFSIVTILSLGENNGTAAVSFVCMLTVCNIIASSLCGDAV